MKNHTISARLLAWFATNARDLPWRKTSDPYGIWVSEVMLQQTQVKTVIPYWERWMRELPTLQALAKAQPSRIHKLWEGLGYYHRVRNMQQTARVISQKHAGRFPQTIEALLDLPGIGPYTAGALCSIAFDQPEPALDGNVIRVLTRVFGVADDPRQTETQSNLWQLAKALVQRAVNESQALSLASGQRSLLRTSKRAGAGGPGAERTPIACSAFQRPASAFNQALMELGALVCTPRDPRCSVCPLAGDCVALRDGKVAELPRKVPRPKMTSRRFLAFVVQHGDRFLVRQRPAGEVNAHLWEFPNIEVTREPVELRKAARRAVGRAPTELVDFGSIKHSITRYRITLDVFRGSLEGNQTGSDGNGRWLTRAALDRLPFASAHKKIRARLHPD